MADRQPPENTENRPETLRDQAALLELALEAEKVSLDRYLEWADIARDPAGKGAFVRLARDEYQHMRFIELHLKALARQGTCSPFEVPQGKVEKLVARLERHGRLDGGPADQPERYILQSALESELRAEKYYTEQAEAGGPVAGLYRRLARAESAHVALIRAEIDHIEKTGFWFDFPEFTLEGA
ncbi:MAG TPA: hypothetical protein ENN51_06540 [candidate division WOR-3 bacterium]|uniref:Rubrerythrin diiron-binding domain-containing protein n=1 Tax=candidate division WOR-3 bacterium TaxID=2052148 RepID=A0A7V0T670_UNCW3|nr:hypothetical protein [candidate division WOR-3 bacterium]